MRRLRGTVRTTMHKMLYYIFFIYAFNNTRNVLM